MDGTNTPTVNTGDSNALRGTGLTGGSGGAVGSVTGVVDTVTGLVEGISDIYWAKKNYDQQKKILDWNKKTQKNIWAREDNAVLRRVLDLRRAGLSPTLAAGSAASAGPAVSVNAPQYDSPNSMSGVALRYLSAVSMKEQIDKTVTENRYIQMQREKAEAEKFNVMAKTAKELHDLKLMKDDGMPSIPSIVGKAARDINGLLRNSSGAKYLEKKFNQGSSWIEEMLDKIYLKEMGKSRPKN